MREVNIAILGFGFMGRVYAYAAQSIKHFYPDAPKICISSVLVTDKVNQFALKSRYDFDTITTDYDTILNNKSINAVYVALPNDQHSSYVIPAIKAGKNVLCEKPLEVNLDKTLEMVEVAKSNKSTIASSVFEYRFLPAISFIKDLIEQEKLGKILQFRLLYLHGSYAEQRQMSWRLKEGIGGALRDLGPHIIDLALYLLGPFKSFDGKLSSKYLSREVDNVAQIICETESGADGYLEVSRLSVGSIDELRIEIHGDQGSIKWNLENMNFLEFFSKQFPSRGYQTIPVFVDPSDCSDFPPEKVSSGWLQAHVNCLYSFTKSVAEDKYIDNRAATFGDGLEVQKIIEGILNSSRNS